MKYRIVRRPSWWPYRDAATTIGSILLMPRWWFDCSDEIERNAMLHHELIHVRQYERDGFVRFLWRYLSSRKWRYAYEVEAYESHARYLIAHGRVPVPDLWARAMSDYGLLSWITCDEARRLAGDWVKDCTDD